MCDTVRLLGKAKAPSGDTHQPRYREAEGVQTQEEPESSTQAMSATKGSGIMSTMEYRVRVIVEERRVIGSDYNLKRTRWVRTGVSDSSVFSSEFDEQIDLYEAVVLPIQTDRKARSSESIKRLKI